MIIVLSPGIRVDRHLASRAHRMACTAQEQESISRRQLGTRVN